MDSEDTKKMVTVVSGIVSSVVSIAAMWVQVKNLDHKTLLEALEKVGDMLATSAKQMTNAFAQTDAVTDAALADEKTHT